MSTEAGSYRELPGFEQKTIPTFIKEIDEKKGVVTHIVSVFGIRDLQGDRVIAGAFEKTISERAGKIRVLDQHDSSSVLNVLGKPLALREIGRVELPPEVLTEYPDATGGLLATTQYAMKTEKGRDTFHLVDGGFLPETSIGYDSITAEYVEEEIDGKTVPTRLLREIRLWEYSNVIWGANPATSTVSAKDAGADVEDDDLAHELAADLDDDPPRYVGDEDKSEDKTEDTEHDEKAGRVFSASNAARIQAAIDNAQEALADLEEMLQAAMPATDDEKATGQSDEAGPNDDDPPTPDATEAGPGDSSPTAGEKLAEIEALMKQAQRELSEET
jgi:phage head maturation protease